MFVQPPSGGTAITAGVLGILGAVWAIIATIVNLSALSQVGSQIGGSPLGWVLDMQTAVFIIELLTLGPGSIMLLVRQAAGRGLVAFGAAIHILQGIVVFAVLLTYSSGNSIGVTNGAFVGGGVIGLLIVLIPAIATLTLALVPLTGRWCAWRTPYGITY